MSGPDPRWRERCEMYFSSMDNFTNQDVRAGMDKHSRRKTEIGHTDENGFPREEIIRFPDYRRNITTFSKKKQPFKSLIRWLSSVDLHGTSMLPRAKSHLFCVCWIFITLVGFVSFIVGSYIFIKDYLDEDFAIKVDNIHDGNNASPLSLMVCNKNIIRKSKIVSGTRFFGLESLNLTHLQTKGTLQNTGKQSIATLLENTDLLSFLENKSLMDSSTGLLSEINKEYISYSQMMTDSDWENLGRALLDIDSNPFPRAFRMTSSEFQEFGHRMESSILGCTKNGRPCDNTEISYVQNAELGNCAEIYLSLENSWFDRLTLTLDVQAEDYLDLVSPAPGMCAVVQQSSSSASLFPTFSHYASFTSNPGEGLHLVISKTHELKRKSKNCDVDPNYNRLECLSLCLELRTAQLCRCSISLQSQASSRCHVNLQYEYVCQRFLQVLYQRNQLPCNCPHQCKEEFIAVSASNFDWIKDESEALLKTSMEMSGKSNNISSLRESITKIIVSWDHSSSITLQEDDQLSLVGLFLKLGSLSAITVGISVITVIELLWLLGKCLVAFCCTFSNKKRDRDDNTVHQIHPAQELYPEFDNIAHNWYAVNSSGHIQGQLLSDPTLGMADSPLNRRSINNYIITPYHTEQHDPSADGQQDVFYRGRARDSGIVYGDNTRDKDFSQIISSEDAPDHQTKRKEENKLFHQPWDRSGQHGVYPRVVVPNLNLSENNEVPLFNSPFMTLKEDYDPDKSRDTADEGNTFQHITKSLQNSDNSKPASGEQSKTESQKQTDFYRPTSNNEGGSGKKEDDNTDFPRKTDENIFKISNADMTDNGWIPEEDNTKTDGPDLSRLEKLFYTSTHKPGTELTTYGDRHYQNQRSRSRNVRGFGRSSKNNKVERVMIATTPVHGSSALQKAKVMSPQTWHYYSEGHQPSLMAPAAYMAPAYDGRTSIYRPPGSYYFQGGAGIVNQEGGRSYYLHS